jgi:hypothetical protein
MKILGVPIVQKRLSIFIVIISLLNIVTSAAQAEEISYKAMLKNNAANVQQIELGMTVAEVTLIMKNYQSEVRDGTLNNPWKIESNSNIEIYHYITRKHPPFTPIRENQTTPIIFEDGKVSAIGTNFLNEARNKSSASSIGTSDGENTVEERLTQLKSLYDKGLIDKESYQEQRERILDSI